MMQRPFQGEQFKDFILTFEDGTTQTVSSVLVQLICWTCTFLQFWSIRVTSCRQKTNVLTNCLPGSDENRWQGAKKRNWKKNEKIYKLVHLNVFSFCDHWHDTIFPKLCITVPSKWSVKKVFARYCREDFPEGTVTATTTSKEGEMSQNFTDI